jgi:beta-lactamase class A
MGNYVTQDQAGRGDDWPQRSPRRTIRLLAPAAGALLAASLLAPAALGAAPAAAATAAPAAATTTVGMVSCTSASHPALAARLASDIWAARRARSDSVALVVEDPILGVSCSLSGAARFDSASVVKVTILGALLRKALDQHRYLTATEASLARAMITQSSNDAASALWAELGRAYIQHFLNLAGMGQTILGPGGYWGLTQITARDETRLLRLLLVPNTVLSPNSRAYALGLMAQVISSQRWGVPAGAPAGVVVHVKNGWLPRATHGWRIHSIGAFTSSRGWYTIVVLTQDNPTMTYGVNTIQNIARVIHRDLNPGATSFTAAPALAPAALTPDELIPALPAIP